VAVGLIFALLSSASVGAQTEPSRPSLKSSVDSNDWGPYFDLGVEKLRRHPQEAADCFYWASRLAPDRAEPLYARWVAFWMLDQERWIWYLLDEREVLRRPEVIQADSLRYRAYLRNPFVHEGLSILLFEQLPGRFRSDPATKGWIAYAAGDLATAVSLLGKAIAADSVKSLWVRQMRASALVNLGQIEGALAEMQALLRQLRREEATTLARPYQSKELVLYSIGLLHASRGRIGPARDAYRQALVENLAFAPAHRRLAALTLQRDPASSASELAQAVELDGDDAVLHSEYGAVLLAGGKPAEAVAEMRLAVAKEPWWADPYFTLGRALEANGAPDQALAAYRMFVARAPRSAVMLSTAEGRISALAPR